MMDWRELVKNKKLLAGIGAAGVLGLYVLWRRGGLSGGGTADQTARVAGDSGGGIGYPSTMDSTGTDIAGWLGSYSAALQAQLDEFGRNINDRLGEIPTAPVQPGPQVPRPRKSPPGTPSRPPLGPVPRWPGLPRTPPQVPRR